jgi:hypothetical protein
MSGSVCDFGFLEAEKFETEYWLTTVSLYINTTKGGFVEKISKTAYGGSGYA